MIRGTRFEWLKLIWQLFMLFLEAAMYVIVMLVIVQWAITGELNIELAIGLILVGVYGNIIDQRS